MKFLIPNYRTPDSFVDNVAFTLEKMGYKVISMPQQNSRFLDNRFTHFTRLLNEAVNPNFFTKQEKWLRKQLQSSQSFQVLLTLTQALSYETLQLAKQKGIVCVGWWGDTPANMKKQGLIVKGWDKLYLKDANATEKLKGLGFDVSLMHEAMNPYWHMPLYTDIAENVIVAGSFYGYRNYLVAEMIRKGVHFNLYGRKLPHWASQSVKDIHLNRFIVKEEKSKLFGGALACLNSTAMSEFNSMNCRAFEIAGAEGLQLLEYRPSVESCFDIDQEIKTFRSIDEAVELVSWAKNYPQEAMQVRRAGRKRALAEHTYEHRLIKIINDIS